MTVTRSELQAWIDAYATPDAPDAQTLADFLGIELAPEPTPAAPVGQRRRSPEGVEVIKTDDGTTDPWRKYRGKPGPTWFADDEVADWEVITDAPECDREHLPDGHVPITFNGWSDDDLRVAARVVESGVLGASIRTELTNRGEGHASMCASCATELDLSPDANWEDATAEEEMA